jgi:putative redox protein
MPEPEPAIVVTHLGGDRLRIETRGHVLFADQPVGDGGDDTACTPSEMFLSSLAACVAFYAERFLGRNRLSTAGLTVGCDYSWAKNPNRIGAIELRVSAPGLTEAKREAFLRVIEHCTVHNTLHVPPEITIRMDASRSSAPPVGLDAVGSPLGVRTHR